MILEIQNSLEGKSFLLKFLESAGNSLNTFRYFLNRPIDCINNHLLTILLVENGIPIAYGHLDKEEDKVWLGICVSEEYTGQSKGKIIMEYLLNYADDKCLTLSLKVDFENAKALSLYYKYGFLIYFTESPLFYLMKRNNSDKN
jgi:GNAT superfamily N-acetyltransferase